MTKLGECIGGQPQLNRVKPGSEDTVVASWFPNQSEYEVMIPTVPVATYRFSDDTRDGITGFIYVEVPSRRKSPRTRV